jgi:branched-chain amino acid transport system ATP-binding protein
MSAVLALQDVHKTFGNTPIIRGISLSIEQGERHAIIGPNGAGKSTLFNLISGRIPPTSGRIRLRDQDITDLPAYRINRLGLSRSFQVTNIFPRLSVYENVRCAVLWPLGYGYSFWHRVARRDDIRDRTEHILAQLKLSERRDVLAGILTYAEQRALELGIAIAAGSDVILLDEPTAGMSFTETHATVDLIRTISEGKTLVIVEHDMSVVFNLAHRISVLVYGQVIATDTPERIRQNPEVQRAYLGTESA